MDGLEELPADALRRRCDPEALGFETTADLPDLEQVLAQDRPVDALQLGMDVEHRGYNIFVVGPAGTGRHTVVMDFLARKAAEEPVPPDWCYVHDFAQPNRPRALQLPAGRGKSLRADMDKFLREIREAIPAAFSSDEYRAEREQLEDEIKRIHHHALEELEVYAKAQRVGIAQTPDGFAVPPMIDSDDFRANWGESVGRSRTNQSSSRGPSAPDGLRDAVLVVHDGGPSPEAVCARLEAAPWTVVCARVDDDLALERSRPTLVVVVVTECSSADPVVRSVRHALPRVPLLVLASHVTPEQRVSLMAAGASDCVAAGAIAVAPEVVLAERVLEMDQLRRRLEDVTDQERARARLARRIHEILGEKLDLLRAAASSVLISLRALRAARTALLTSGEATVVDSLCTSVESMFPLFDTIASSTPADGHSTEASGRRGSRDHPPRP